jgi:ribosomal protein S11
MIFFNYKRFSIKVPQSTKLRKVKDIHFFKGFKKFWSLKSSFSGNSTYKFFFLNDLGNLESSPFLIKNSKFFNYFNSNPPPPLIKRIPKYFYTTKKYKKIYSPKLKFFRSFRKTIFFFKVYRKKSRYHRYKRFYRYKNIRNRFRFFASQQNLSKNSQISILSSFIVKKKKAKFLPFLGFFSKFGRVFYKFRRKRIKFKKFFKKYFRLFRSFSGTTTKKFKKIRKHFSSIKLYLHIFRSINNIFVNLSAPKGRSVYVYSAGRTFYKGSKRLSPIAVETMGKNISNIFKASKIDNIYLVFHCPIDYLCRSLMRGISRNIKFSGFSYYLNKPHNGLRKRSTRRV